MPEGTAGSAFVFMVTEQQGHCSLTPEVRRHLAARLQMTPTKTLAWFTGHLDKAFMGGGCFVFGGCVPVEVGPDRILTALVLKK